MPGSIAAQIQALEVLGERLDKAQQLLDKHHNELVSFLACMPLPAWIKDLNSRMIYINPAYEREYGISVEIYNSKLDAEVWDNEEVVGEYVSHDGLVIRSQAYRSLTEYYVDPQGVKHPIEVLKWPLIVNGMVVGVAGVALIEV